MAHHLQPILDDLIFVGGCAAALLVPPPADANLRPTDDVDCVVSISSYAEFSALEIKLRKLGCVECRDEGAPVCRWVVDGALVDFMPTEERVLGFCNKWYREVVKDPVLVEVETGVQVKVVNIPLFLATKFEAFSDRGGGGYYGNSDIEDIISILAYRRDSVQLIAEAPAGVRQYLAAEARQLLALRSIENIVSGCFEADQASQALVPTVMAALRGIATSI